MAHQMVQQAIESSLLQAAQAMEEQIDSQLHRLDNMDEDDLERVRQRRIDEMKRMQQKRVEWAAKGHGEYREIEEKEFFKEAKGVERVVVHFYRQSFPCDVMHKHLAALAPRHLETKFLKVHAEKAPFLTERLKVWMLPTLAVVKDGKTTDYVVGLDDLGGVEDFKSEVLVARLAAAGAIFEDSVTAPAAQRAAPARTLRQGGPKRTESDEDSDFE